MAEIDYETLRVVILQQAVKDYELALRKNKGADALALERWFMGGWGQTLSGNQGDLIIAECKKRVTGKDEV